MASGYDLLIEKLDSFIRKYYKNLVLRGLLYTVALIGLFFLTISLLEYFGNFGMGVRKVLFFSFLLGSIYIIARFIITPLVKLYHLGKVISYEQASQIIGKHFTEVQDKLLNTLQLKQSSFSGGASQELISASIDQKAGELSPVPFNNAIDLGENRKYLKYALPPLAILLIILFAAPSIIKDSTKRLVRFNEEFVPEAPFQFHLLNSEESIASGTDLMLQIELTGAAFPPHVQIDVQGNRFRMDKQDALHFNYQLKNIQEDLTFSMEADGFRSKTFTIKVLPKPALRGFQVSLDYPAYTGIKDEVLRNTGDLSVPVGTQVRWQFDTENTQSLHISMGDSSYTSKNEDKELFSFTQRLMSSGKYTISTRNRYMVAPDSITYSINVIPDLYPEIQVEEQADSTNDRNLYFRGEIRDDHGFSKLGFHYRLLSERTDSLADTGPQMKILSLDAKATAQGFYHAWSLDALNIKAGDEVEYYFEVWDNDGVHGAKSARSKKKIYEAPTLEELKQEQDQSSADIKKDMEKSIKDAKELQKEVEKLQRELMDKKELDWQDKKKLEKLMEKQKKLEQQVQSIQEQNDERMQQEERYETMDEKLMDKQKQLQELFNSVLNEEMKDMYREMQKLMEQMDQDKLREQLEKMQLSQEDIEAELDRNLELFKQMEFEQKAEEVKEKLDEIQKKQDELAEDSENKEKSAEEIKKEQDELNKEFEELQKELDELEKLNEELEEKNDMDMMGLEEQVEEEMKKSSESLSKGQKGKAGESQKKASEKMQQMSQMMDAMAGGGGGEAQEEDLDALRALLENVIELSFDQEEVMEALKILDSSDPKYLDHAKTQRKLKDDAEIIKDSLRALSKRVIQIQPIVNKEINSINANMDGSIADLAERSTPEATVKQQLVMTSLNNLALLLDEALQQMMQQMANAMPGSGNCEKPGGKGQGKSGGKPKMGDMGKMQKALSDRLEQLQKGMQPGGKAGPGRFGMSEELARTAAEQGAIRRELERLSQELNKDGSGNGNQLKEIAKEMEENEKDLVNMQITKRTLDRQQDILTRLLESEKAEREREQDNKRRSNEAQTYELSSPENFFEYQKAKAREVELLRTVSPSLKPYYRNKVNEYFLNFDAPVKN